MKLIAGLGNPGERYAKTRHNIGFCVLDRVFEKIGAAGEREKFRGLLAEKIVEGEKVLFLKPQTFMNSSGDAVIEALNFYKIDPAADLLVIHDDLDLPPGKIRIRSHGGSGGHNGLKSIISHIGENFWRIKCGIGRPDMETIDFVLGRFTEEEKQPVADMLILAADAVLDFMEDMDRERWVQKYNKK